MLDKSPARPAVNVPNDLAAFWMPFTANRAFKKAPRLLAGAKGMHYIDCAATDLPYGRQLIADIQNRTEIAMPQAHCFKAMELALTAQALAERDFGRKK